MEMVKAVVFPEAEKADITEVPLAEPGPADLVVDTLYSGISIGTEGWVFRAKYKDTKFPLIPGYMAVGTVSHVGEGVRDFREGEVVFVNTGVKYRDEVGPVISWGHHASRLVVPAEWGKVFKVPPDLDLRAVSISVLPAVALHGIHTCGVAGGEVVMVFGLGVVGISAVQFLHARRCPVVAVEPVARRRDLVEALDNVEVFSPDDDICGRSDILPEGTGDVSSAGGADIVIDTSGSAKAVNQAFDFIKLYGKFVFQGYYPDLTPLDLFMPHVRQIVAYFPCHRCDQDIQDALDAYARGELNLATCVTHEYNWDRASEAFALLTERPEDMVSIVLKWGN